MTLRAGGDCAMIQTPAQSLPADPTFWIWSVFHAALISSAVAPGRLAGMDSQHSPPLLNWSVRRSEVRRMFLALLATGLISTLIGWEAGPFFAFWGTGWALIWATLEPEQPLASTNPH